MGEDPEAQDGVEAHEDQHRRLAPERSLGVSKEAQGDQVRQVDGDDVPGDDQGHLRVPDERRVHDAYLDLVARGAEEVPAPAERVRNVSDYPLPLDEQVRVVVGYLVGDRDWHERVHVGGRKPPERHLAPRQGAG